MYKNSCIWVHRTDVRHQPFSLRQKAEILKQILNKPWWWLQAMAPHSLRLGLPAPQPSRRHHTQSLLGTSFHDPRTHHVLESNPERAAPLSRRDDEWCHAIVSHSALALRLYLAVYNTSSSCRFWVLDRLCSNLSQSFHPIPHGIYKTSNQHRLYLLFPLFLCLNLSGHLLLFYKWFGSSESPQPIVRMCLSCLVYLNSDLYRLCGYIYAWYHLCGSIHDLSSLVQLLHLHTHKHTWIIHPNTHTHMCEREFESRGRGWW